MAAHALGKRNTMVMMFVGGVLLIGDSTYHTNYLP